eukprot:6492610-Amphidinium_carterae.3
MLRLVRRPHPGTSLTSGERITWLPAFSVQNCIAAAGKNVHETALVQSLASYRDALLSSRGGLVPFSFVQFLKPFGVALFDVMLLACFGQESLAVCAGTMVFVLVLLCKLGVCARHASVSSVTRFPPVQLLSGFSMSVLLCRSALSTRSHNCTHLTRAQINFLPTELRLAIWNTNFKSTYCASAAA